MIWIKVIHIMSVIVFISYHIPIYRDVKVSLSLYRPFYPIYAAVKKVLRKNVFFQKYLKNLILCFRARKGILSCCFEKCFKALSYMNLKFETVRGEVLTFAFIYILFLNYMHDLRKLKCPSSLLLIITH